MRNALVAATLCLCICIMAVPASAQVGSGPAPPSAPTPDKYGNLSWNASTTSNVTYNVYRGIVAGGTKGRVNPAPVTVLTYRDATASTPPPTFGQLNFYCITAQNTSGVESVCSNEASATAVQGSPAAPTNLNIVLAFLEKIGSGIFAALKFLGSSFLA